MILNIPNEVRSDLGSRIVWEAAFYLLGTIMKTINLLYSVVLWPDV